MSSLDAQAPPVTEADDVGLTRTVAAATAAVVALACLFEHGLGIDVLFGTAFIVVLAVVSVVDWEERRIPNNIVLPAAAFTVAAVWVLHPDELRASLIAGAVAFAFFFVPAFFAPSRTVGMGDAKLALLVGLALGGDALLGFFVTSFAAGGYALVLILTRGSEARNEGLPFGPFLAIGAAVALVVGGGSLYA
jgi:leader peptidase (prepilin peptidase) / N-methyltransferase